MTYRADQFQAAQLAGAAPLVTFLLVVCLAVLLYLLYGADSESTTDIYAGRSLRPVTNALALTGDYISVITLLSVTGSVALAGYDGMALAAGGVGALGVLLLLAQPLRNIGGFTLGDTWGARFPGVSTRVAGTVATLCFCLPLTVAQLAVAGAAVAYLMGLSDFGAAGSLCTVFIGIIMICAASLSGMRGNGVLQAIKTVVLLLAMAVLAGQIMGKFGWSPSRLVDAAAERAGDERAYTGGLFGGHGATGTLSQLSAQVTVVLGAGVAPHMLMRLRASDRGESARRTVRHTVGLATVFSGLAVLLGLGAAALVGARGIAAADSEGLAALPLLALRLAADKSDGGATLALAVSMIFLTSLTVVASLTLSSAASLAHDVYASTVGRGRSMTSEIRAVRWSGALVGVVAILLAVGLGEQNLSFLSDFAVATSAAAILPTLVLGLFWSGFTRTGMLWSVYGGIGCCVVLQFFGPSMSGTPTAIWPDVDFAWFPLETTGLVSVPVSFLLAWTVSRARPTPTPPVAFEELEKRALTGFVPAAPSSPYRGAGTRRS